VEGLGWQKGLMGLFWGLWRGIKGVFCVDYPPGEVVCLWAFLRISVLGVSSNAQDGVLCGDCGPSQR